MKKKLSLCLTVALLLCLLSGALAAQDAQVIKTSVSSINKSGALVLDLKGSELLAAGYAYGDVITVTVAGESYSMPIVSSSSDARPSIKICVVKAQEPDNDTVYLTIYKHSLAKALGIAKKRTIDEDPGYRWDYTERYCDGVSVSLSMYQPGGYASEYTFYNIHTDRDRDHFSDLTDAQFANFRCVDTTGMGANVLYRASSPIDNTFKRAKQSAAAVEAAGIRTVLNLSDSKKEMKGSKYYKGSYYASLDVLPMHLYVDPGDPDFNQGLADGLRYLIDHEGPYLVHCKAGRDRTGFVCALLEALMGGTREELIDDYILSFYNMIGAEATAQYYDLLVHDIAVKAFSDALGVEDAAADGVDLAACVENYLLQIGMTDAEIAALKARLGTDIA